MKMLLLIPLLALLMGCRTVADREAEEKILETSRRLQQAPLEAALMIELGDRLAKRGYSEGAIRVWEAGSEAHPEDLRFLRRIGDEEFGLGLKRKSLATYEKILARSQGDPDLFYRMGWAYLETADLDKGLAMMERVRRLRPREARGYAGLGYAQLRMSEQEGKGDLLEKAVATLKQGTLADKKNVLIWHLLGQASVRQENLEQAKKHYQTALDLDPEHLESLENLAWLYWQEGKTGNARPLLERALKLEKDERKLKEIRKLLAAAP